MTVGTVVSGAALVVALIAFALTGALSLRARVEPLWAMVRAIVAFLAVLWIARWSAGVLDALGPASQGKGPRDEPDE